MGQPSRPSLLTVAFRPRSRAAAGKAGTGTSDRRRFHAKQGPLLDVDRGYRHPVDARRRLRRILLLAVLCLMIAGCGTGGNCLPQPVQLIGTAVTSSQVERSVGLVTTCLLPGVGCERGTAFPIGAGYWLTAASLGENPAMALRSTSPRWSIVTVTTGGHRYRAAPARVSATRGYALLDVPGTAGVRGLPLDAGAPQPLDDATVVCAEAARTVVYSGSLFLNTPPLPDVDLFQVNSPRVISSCTGGPVLDRGLVVGVQLFALRQGAWAAPTFAMTDLPSTSTAVCTQ